MMKHACKAKTQPTLQAAEYPPDRMSVRNVEKHISKY